MAQKSNNPKQAEIELIEKLFAMNGYFAAAFTRDDVTMMQCNINADYDLLCRTGRDESDKIGQLKRQLEQADKDLTEKTRLISELTTERDAAIENYRAAQEKNHYLQNELHEKSFDIENLKCQIIRRDLLLGKELTEEQRQKVIEMLEGYED